jgi:hypothetical protein
MELAKALSKTRIFVQWEAAPDVDERLRRVYDLLLRANVKERPVDQRSILQILRQGIAIEDSNNTSGR